MKISYNWLKNYLPAELSPEKIAELLTNCGLEVESVEQFESHKGGLAGIVVGEVISCERHPNADKLSLTSVSIGGTAPLRIVCGAPNVAAGQKVIVATPGTKLYPVDGEPFEIRKSKIRGESSEGMICAEDEIGLGSSHDGIMVLPQDTRVGMTAAEYFGVEHDVVFEIGLTPNRADAASHYGVARDLRAAMFAESLAVPELSLPSVDGFKATENSPPVIVSVLDFDACPRYSGLTIEGISVKDSPAWLQNRLRSVGLNPINNIVDITNFVMLECGQPLHAFDADKIEGGKVIVRMADPSEKFTTLDEVERSMFPEDLMICSETRPMCIAGVFGGLNSGISINTKNVFLESACFNPDFIRKTGKRHGLKTDASFRFERGTDPEMTIYALRRAALLITEIAGGKITGQELDLYPEPVEHKEISLSFNYLDSFIGESIERSRIVEILKHLEIKVLSFEGDRVSLKVPPFKVDVIRPVDIAEEILRIHGYNRIAIPQKLSSSLPSVKGLDRDKLQNKVSDYLSSNGFLEMLNNSLGKSQLAELSGISQDAVIKIMNPLSQDLDSLRWDMLFSGLSSVEYNRNRKNPDLRLYEFGKVYSISEGKRQENYRLAVFLSGRKADVTWTGDKSAVNFFFLKSFIENILSLVKVDIHSLKQEDVSDSRFSYGLQLKSGDEVVLSYGLVRKQILRNFDITNEVFFADINWDQLIRISGKIPVRVSELSKFPSVRRDLSMLINSNVSFSDITSVAGKTERKILKDVNLFDVYQGDKLEKNKKSYAVSFILQNDQQTLTDKEIDKVMEKLMTAFEKELGAQIRKS
ncbi:MAG: phenylalanine--tRNA ligase subunit beta [Bacteroidetes bacterium]|nr:MAG: phenylalanine--tRNA ligase subunit beta [Bacteroidota bacterium]REK05169.1 MAG: phenylalanine--tRNA ligase subunit beta [Bacteroidota bacterium]REK32574.1 MAG: phenylalanine--tRNA ligase subunit beta [Bacteroidota bacterium]REK48979.1 MAG: phenylalanine--tRNA ligase subunit beta [Bacteroidota bacterium]